MNKRVLVAVDETEESARVAEFVNAFFAGSDVEIIGLHVASTTLALPPTPVTPDAGLWWAYPAPNALGSGPYLVGSERGNGEEDDRRHGEEVVERAGLEADRVEVEVGDPVEAIRHVAEQEDVDVIAVASTNRGWFERLLAGGSVAEELARSSPRPVLIV